MPIEFYCPECDTLLRTPEAKAGLSAKCPACHERIWVPHESELFDDPTLNYRSELPSESKRSRADGQSEDAFSNPFDVDDGVVEETEILESAFEEDLVCLQCGTVNPWDAQKCESCGQAISWGKPKIIRSVDLGEILSVSWEIYSKNLGICILAALVDFLLMMAATIIILIPCLISIIVLKDVPVIGIPAFFVVFFLGLGMSVSALWIGQFRFFLELVRGQKPEISTMFHVGNLVGRMLVASLGFSIMLVMGAMMCLLPGLLVIVLFWPFGRFLVDHDCSAGESLSGAYQLVQNNFWTSVMVVILFILIGFIANAVVLGILFSIPFNAVMFTVAYLHFSGEFVTGQE